MTGLVGGAVTGTALRSMVDRLHHESWYESVRREEGPHGVGMSHHGDRDPAGWTAWQGDGRAGVVHGAVWNGPSDEADLFEGVLDDPAGTLAGIDGSFVLVALGDERLVAATDKIGSRPCYYTTGEEPRFASGLPPLLADLDEPTLNEQAVSDMLLMGHMWGTKTLLTDVQALDPGTMLVVEEEPSVRRYWRPDFDATPEDEYLDHLADTFHRTIDDMVESIDGTAGLWLSGGLDSRALAGELVRCRRDPFESLVGYTYDSNPKGGGNPELARKVGSTLGFDVDTVRLTPDDFLDALDVGVDLTDGMLRWSSFLNASAVFNLPSDEVDVYLEGAGQGELMGHHLRKFHFTGCSSAVESMHRSESMVSPDRVHDLMAGPVDPLRSYREVAEASDESTLRGKVLDAHYNYYYSRMTYANNELMQSQAGVRVPFGHGEILDVTARLPLEYRMKTLPLTNGSIPYGVAESKLVLTRRLDAGLEDIRYERTGVAPKYPLPVHVAGFLAKSATAKLLRETGPGGPGIPDVWYRKHDGFRHRLDDLIASACDRPLFDGDSLKQLQREHRQERGNHVATSLSAVTTLELWLQRHLD